MTRPEPYADSVSMDGRVGNGLLVLGLATQIGLLSYPWARWAGALLPLAGATVVLFARPLGNRVLATGLAALGGVLLLALWWFPVFFRMLVVLVGIILVVAGVLKHRGKW